MQRGYLGASLPILVIVGVCVVALTGPILLSSMARLSRPAISDDKVITVSGSQRTAVVESGETALPVADKAAVPAGKNPSGHAVSEPALICKLGFDHRGDVKDWNELAFNGSSKYSVGKGENGEAILKASSKGACSGLFKEVSTAAEDRPRLSWEWRVTKFPSKKRKGSSLVEKSDCDFGARVCVVFAGDTPFTSQYIWYVWDDRYPAGAYADSSGFLNRTRVLVVEDSPGGEGSKWVSETRDVMADYEKLFGSKPTRAFHSVGLMTDSDGTQTVSAAEFRNVRILKGPAVKGVASRLGSCSAESRRY